MRLLENGAKGPNQEGEIVREEQKPVEEGSALSHPSEGL